MNKGKGNILISTAGAILAMLFFVSCSSSDQMMRTPEDIMGVWSKESDRYIEFSTNNEAHKLLIYDQNSEKIGDWYIDAYFYEPGYNLVIYINENNVATVYQVIALTDSKLTWCPVDELPPDSINKDNIGNVIGGIINKAQEGYHLNPELYESYSKIPYYDFLELLESLDIMYPWGDF